MRKIIPALTTAALLAACNQGPLFYAELEEPRLCKTIPAEDLPPFEGTAPGQELRYPMAIPVGAELPLFSGGDGGTSDVETEIRMIEMTLVARSGITDFNQIDTAAITVEPPPGSSQPPALLISYAKDPASPPGDRLVVAGDQGVNLIPYLFDPGAGGGGFDGGTAPEGTILVEATMTGALPENSWTADIRVCIYMRTRFNYLNAYGF